MTCSFDRDRIVMGCMKEVDIDSRAKGTTEINYANNDDDDLHVIFGGQKDSMKNLCKGSYAPQNLQPSKMTEHVPSQ